MLLLGLRPALRMILESKPSQQVENLSAMNTFGANAPQLPSQGTPLGLPNSNGMSSGLIAEFSEQNAGSNPVQQKLEEIISRDSDRAAKILKKWLAEPKKSAA